MVAAMLRLVAQLLHAALMLAAAPLLLGLIRHLRARLLGHAGPPLVQPWRDLIRLARKQPVLAESASPLLGAAPFVDFAASLAAASLVPGFALGMITAPLADLLLLAGLLALAQVALALAAMDVGTATGGIGASRATALAAFAAPALFAVIFALALAAGTTNLDSLATLRNRGTIGFSAAHGLALAALIIIALAGNGSVPADHAAARWGVRCDYSGRHLALVEWAASLRLLLMLSLIVAAFAPFGAANAAGTLLAWPVGLLAWGVKIVVLAFGLAVAETAAARLRLSRLPELLGVALALALLAVILLCVGQGFA